MSRMTRPMVTVGIAFLSAAFAVSFFGWQTAAGLAGVVAVLLAVAGLTLPKGSRAKPLAVLASVLVAFVSCAWGGGRVGYDFASLAGERHVFTGTIQSIGESSSGSTALSLRITGHDIPGAPSAFNAILYTRMDWDCEEFDEITVEAKCLSMSGTPTFDSARYYRGQGVQLLLSSYTQAEVRSPAIRPLLYYPRHWSRLLGERAERMFTPGDAALVKAVLLGDDSGIEAAQDRAFSIAGMSHLFVVSGMHVSLMAGLILLLLRRLRLSERFASILAIGGVWFFVMLTGLGLPAVRAGVMMTVLLVGKLFRRPADGLNSLFLAGTLIVLAQPHAILNAGFQLSFAATFGAIQFAGPITGWMTARWNAEKGLPLRCCELLGLSLGCNLALLPLLPYLFSGISLIFPLTNLVSVPLLPLVLVCSLLTLLLPGVPLLTVVLQTATSLLLRLLTGIAGLAAELPFAYLGLDYDFVPPWIVCFVVLLAAAFLFGRRRERRIRRRAMAGMTGLMLCGLVFVLLWHGAWNRDVGEIVVVSSFEARSIVFTWRGGATVVTLRDDDRVDAEVERYLRGRNIHRIDNLVLAYGNTKAAADTVLLADALPVGNVLLFSEDELLPYAGDLLHPQNGVYPMRIGHGFDLLPIGGDGLLELYRSAEGIQVTMTLGHRRVILTDHPVDEKCEILFYADENFDFLRQNSAGYVILLEESEENWALSLSNGIAAWEGIVRLRFDGDGNYRLKMGEFER